VLSAILSPLLKYIAGGLAILCVVLGIALKVEQAHARKSATRVVELTQLRAADRASFIAAQKQAEADAQANVQRVTIQQQRITSDVQSDYARQLADLRARFMRASRADPGKPQGPTVPANGAAPGGTDDSAREQLLPSERQLAAEISLLLKSLQDWFRRQSAVNPNH
jgi:hypothetical protein